MIYLCTEIVKGEAYSRHLEVNSWAEAEAECARLGWHLEGELDSLMDASSGAIVYSHDDTIKEIARLTTASQDQDGGA